jgi:hypothetical protein
MFHTFPSNIAKEGGEVATPTTALSFWKSLVEQGHGRFPITPTQIKRVNFPSFTYLTYPTAVSTQTIYP